MMQNRTFIYDLLTSSRIRMWRHIVFIIVLFFISLNNTLVTYNFRATYDFAFFLNLLFTTLSYLSAVYFNLYYLIPNLLLRKKYFGFILGIIGTTLFLELLLNVIEYLTYVVAGVPIGILSVFQSYNSFWLEFLFNTTQLSICIMGAAAIVLLKQWIKEDRNIMRLKNEFLQSEIEQMKERISPHILFKILHNAANQSKDNPEEVSAILVKLSQVLRYQLYDCSRDRVLLKSEIAFVDNYLTLLKMNDRSFSYIINFRSKSDFTFVPPLLFTSLLQIMIDKSISVSKLEIEIDEGDDCIHFSCRSTNNQDILNNSDLSKIQQRLELLYSDKCLLVLAQKRNQIIMKIPA